MEALAEHLRHIIDFFARGGIEAVVIGLLSIVGGARTIVAVWPDSWLAGPLTKFYRALEWVALNALDRKTNELAARAKTPR